MTNGVGGWGIMFGEDKRWSVPLWTFVTAAVNTITLSVHEQMRSWRYDCWLHIMLCRLLAAEGCICLPCSRQCAAISSTSLEVRCGAPVLNGQGSRGLTGVTRGRDQEAQCVSHLALPCDPSSRFQTKRRGA